MCAAGCTIMARSRSAVPGATCAALPWCATRAPRSLNAAAAAILTLRTLTMKRAACARARRQITQRGESTWYEDLQLLAIYVVLGLTFYFV